MKLVIAEKPSVAQSLASVLGAREKKDGYIEGNGWRMSWCLGHLAGLADADSYDPKYAKWRYDDLPILPKQWQMKVSKEKNKQFHILQKLLNEADTDEVINACDAGREVTICKRVVTERDLSAVYDRTVCAVHIGAKSILTDLARDYAQARNVAIIRDGTDR